MGVKYNSIAILENPEVLAAPKEYVLLVFRNGIGTMLHTHLTPSCGGWCERCCKGVGRFCFGS